jgi:two-component system, chemotaxis family, chemotaxis protein CheY
MAKKVMVVDDSPLSRVMIAKAVGLEGDFDILEVAGGADAIRIQSESPADLIFLDLTMPEVSGYDVLAAMDGANVPIVVVTADRQKRTAERIMELGARAVMPKPPTRAMIREALKGL